MSKSIISKIEMTTRERFFLLLSPIILFIANILTLEYFAPVCGVEKFKLFDQSLTSHRCLESARFILVLSVVGLFLVIVNFFLKKYKFFAIVEFILIILAIANILVPLFGPGACMMPGMVCRKHSFPLTNTFSAVLIFSILASNLFYLLHKKSKEFTV